MYLIPCRQCKKEFLPPGGQGNRQYCDECRAEKLKPANAPVDSCIHCGGALPAYKGSGARPKACSRECSTRASKKRQYAIKSAENWSRQMRCACCGVEFIRKDGGFKYCSLKCSQKVSGWNGRHKRRGLKKSADYIETVRFLSIFERDDGDCQHCGIKTSQTDRGLFIDQAPEIDHIIPISRGGHHAEYNCQILCRECNTKKGNKIFPQDIAKATKLWPTELHIYAAKAKEKKRRLAKPKAGESGIIGVAKDRRRGVWIASIQVGYERKHLGTFKTIEEAAKVRKAAEDTMWGTDENNAGG